MEYQNKQLQEALFDLEQLLEEKPELQPLQQRIHAVLNAVGPDLNERQRALFRMMNLIHKEAG